MPGNDQLLIETDQMPPIPDKNLHLKWRTHRTFFSENKDQIKEHESILFYPLFHCSSFTILYITRGLLKPPYWAHCSHLYVCLCPHLIKIDCWTKIYIFAMHCKNIYFSETWLADCWDSRADQVDSRSSKNVEVAIQSWWHTSYLSFFLHGQNFWKIKFTPKFTQ